MAKMADDNNFDEIVAEEGTPVLVDFWAPWCKPCIAFTPVLEEAESQANGRFRLIKVNIDECGQLAEKFNIRSLPTLMIIRDGQSIARKVGSISRPALQEWLTASLA